MRKKPENLEEARQDIAKRYKNGTKTVVRGKLDPEDLSSADQEWLRTKAVFLKANDASYSYISDAIRIPRSTIKGWFEEPTMKSKVAEIRDDMLQGAIKYLRTYALELIMLLVEIAQNRDVDARTRIQAITEALDRLGMSKVNKSESVTAQTIKQEFDISDPEGIVESLRDNPQLATAAANKLQELQALVSEGAVKDDA